MKKFKDKSIRFQLKNSLSTFFVLLIAVVSLNLVGCQTSQIAQVDAPAKPSYWVFRTNVYSAKKNKNVSGYTHITYMNPQLLRLDVYDPLGLLNFGTLIYKEGQFEAIVPMEKKYFFGIASAESMAQILKSPIEPSLFVNIIFQKKITSKDWICTEDSQGFARDCRNRMADIDIVWKKNITSNDGWVVVTHPEGEVDLKLKNSRSIPTLKAEKFKLQVPNSYDKFQVDSGSIKKL